MVFPHESLVARLPPEAIDLALVHTNTDDDDGCSVWTSTLLTPSDDAARVCWGLVTDTRTHALVAACMPRLSSCANQEQDVEVLAVDKLDGTYTQVFIHGPGRRVCMSTRQAMVAEGDVLRRHVLEALGISDEAVFQRVLYDAMQGAQVHTLWLELTSPHVRRVTLYPSARVWLTGGYLVSGGEMDRDMCRDFVASIQSVAKLYLPGERRATLRQLQHLLLEQDAEGLVTEGFVIVGGTKRYKLKSAAWTHARVPLHDASSPELLLDHALHRREAVRDLMDARPDLIATCTPALCTVEYVQRRLVQLWRLLRGKTKLERYKAASAAEAGAGADGALLYDWLTHDTDAPPRFEQVLRHNPFATAKRRLNVCRQLNLAVQMEQKPPCVPAEWTVFGCRDSTDVDVFVFARNMAQLHAQYDIGYFERLFPGGRAIDLNVGLIREQRPGVFHIKQTTKGPAAFTHQMVWATARSPTPLTGALDEKLSTDDMVCGVATHTLRYMEDLVAPDVYARERACRSAAFRAMRIDYAVNVMRMITSARDTPEWRDAIKSLVLKLAQVGGESQRLARVDAR